MTENYTATVELDIRDDGTGDRDDNIISALEAYSPAVGRSPLGNIEVVVTVPAATLTQAAQTISSVIAEGIGATILSIELMSVDEYSRRVGIVPMPELVSVTTAAEIAGVSRQAILSRLESGSITGEKVGNTWVVQKSSVYPVLDLVDGDHRTVHKMRGEPLETITHDGVTYRKTGGRHNVGGGTWSISYAPDGSGIGFA